MNLAVPIKFIVFKVSRVMEAIFSLKSTFAWFFPIFQRALVDSPIIESDDSKDKFTISEESFLNSLTVRESTHAVELIFMHLPFVMIAIMVLDIRINTLSVDEPSLENIAFCILDHALTVFFAVLVDLTCVLGTVVVFDFRLLFAHLVWINKKFIIFILF